MKIGIDCQYLLTNVAAGPEKYTINLVSSLLSIDSENEYVLYFNADPTDNFLKKLIGFSENVECKVLSSKISWTQCALMRELRKDPPDVFFTPFHTLPIFATLEPFRLRKVKWVSMIHGLDFLYEHKSFFKRFWQSLPLSYTILFSDRLIIPSEHTKKKLEKRWFQDTEKIFVIPEGVGDQFKKYNQEVVSEVQERYDLKNVPYLMFISTIQPRKNVPGLIEGFSKALKTGKIFPETKLVLAGKKGWDFEESFEAPQEYDVEENVRFLGRVPDEYLPYLLAGSKAYVSVSFEEGFGLPLLEAMSSEVPCVVSNIPSYKNLAKDSVLFVDPLQPESISKGIIKALVNYPSDFIEKASNKAREYSWVGTARKTLKVLEK